jgi:hypothetical protein
MSRFLDTDFCLLLFMWEIATYATVSAETCSIDNTSLNKGHADIVAYKGVFIYFLSVVLLLREIRIHIVTSSRTEVIKSQTKKRKTAY